MAQYDTVWTRMTQSSIKQIAFHPNSQLIATGNSSAYLSIWDVPTGVELRRFSCASSNLAVEFTEYGKYLAFGGGADQGGVKIIDCDNWQDYKMIVTPTNSLAFINNANMIAIGGRKSISIWDFQTGELIKKINDIVSPDQQGSYYELFKMVYTPLINSIIYTSTDGKLRFLNIQTYTIDYTYNAGYGELAISDNGKYIAFKTGLSGFAVQVMDIETKQIVQSIPGSPSGITSIAFSPDGKYLAVAYELAGACKIWDIETGKIVYDFINGTHQNVAYSLNNQYIVTSIAQLLILYNNPLTSVQPNLEIINTIFPNPTNQLVNIQFILPRQNFIKIDLLNLEGKKINNIFSGLLESGKQNIEANIEEISTGVYYIVISSTSLTQTFKLIIEK
ncbi:MAG: hypothetical protein A2X64_04625 [Ignavibacteria bacterium GWF2_33_9]|nr:MAG: hypothetical protein A2X64_04625 [Ignavibacteria bacterium GWF2_33_9]